MSKATPGPWTWNKDDTDRNIVGANGRSILEGCWYNTSDAGAYLAKDEDARLIAAAPDLLEACKAALGVIDCEDMGYERNTDEIKMLRAAIAKAENK